MQTDHRSYHSDHGPADLWLKVSSHCSPAVAYPQSADYAIGSTPTMELDFFGAVRTVARHPTLRTECMDGLPLFFHRSATGKSLQPAGNDPHGTLHRAVTSGWTDICPLDHWTHWSPHNHHLTGSNDRLPRTRRLLWATPPPRSLWIQSDRPAVFDHSTDLSGDIQQPTKITQTNKHNQCLNVHTLHKQHSITQPIAIDKARSPQKTSGYSNFCLQVISNWLCADP